MSAERTRGFGGIRLLSLDIDGVMTDGGLYYSEDGKVSRKFNVKDGVGIERAIAAGVIVAIISAGTSGSIEHRAKKLGIRHVFTAVRDKRETLIALARELGIALEDVAHVGDDINDVPLLEIVGFPISVADGMREPTAIAAYITRAGGGKGAVREVCDMIVAERAASALSAG